MTTTISLKTAILAMKSTQTSISTKMTNQLVMTTVTTIGGIDEPNVNLFTKNPNKWFYSRPKPKYRPQLVVSQLVVRAVVAGVRRVRLKPITM